MIENKTKFILLIMIILIYFLCIGIIYLIYVNVENLNGSIGYDKMVISLKCGNIEGALNKSQIENIKKVIKDELITYFTFQDVNIKSEFNNENIKLYGVGGDFKEFYNMDIKGSFLTKISQTYGEKVIVLDDKIANKLFGTENVEGLNVGINGETFKIIGVISIKKSIVDKILDTDKFAFIPLSAMKSINSDNSSKANEIFITNMEISMKSIDFHRIKNTIKIFGINEENFIVENFKLEGLKVAQRKKLLIFFVTCIFIYNLIKKLIISINIFINKIKVSLKKDYFSQVIVKKWRVYILDILKMVLILVIIIFIWKISTFELYIDPNNIPDDPTSLNQIITIFMNNMKRYFVKKDNIYMFSSFKRSNYLINFSKICLGIGFICSILIFGFVKKVVNKGK